MEPFRPDIARAFEIGFAHQDEVHGAVTFSEACPILIEGGEDHPVEDVQGSKKGAGRVGAGAAAICAPLRADASPYADLCLRVRRNLFLDVTPPRCPPVPFFANRRACEALPAAEPGAGRRSSARMRTANQRRIAEVCHHGRIR